MLQPHQERVITERSELAMKVDKLTEFLLGDIFKGLDERERMRLMKQHTFMERYLQVLDERICAFPVHHLMPKNRRDAAELFYRHGNVGRDPEELLRSAPGAVELSAAMMEAERRGVLPAIVNEAARLILDMPTEQPLAFDPF